MRIAADSFGLVKAGNATNEYEDAAWPIAPVDDRFTVFRAAVADGATETSFSGEWARLLVRAYESGFLIERPVSEAIADLEKRWRKQIVKTPLPWYAEQKLEAGAFASLVGITFTGGVDGEAEGKWDAYAVGDCCVMHVRNRTLLRSFPLTKAQDFNSRPSLISTLASSNSDIAVSTRTEQGTWLSGDRFYLMSDALACWFLKRLDLPDGDPWEFIESIETSDDFAKNIDLLRQDNSAGSSVLKNDDVTLVRCELRAD